MLNSNALCTIRPRAANPNVYGEYALLAGHNEPCAIVLLKTEAAHTTVRANSSATLGHAFEFLASNKVLLDGHSRAKIGDQLKVQGFLIRITALRPQLDVLGGTTDHFEVSGESWPV